MIFKKSSRKRRYSIVFLFYAVVLGNFTLKVWIKTIFLGNHLSKRRTRCQFLKSRVPFFYCFVSNSQLATGVGSWQISSVFASTVFRYEGFFLVVGFSGRGGRVVYRMILKLLEKFFLFSRKISICEERTSLANIRYRVLPT